MHPKLFGIDLNLLEEGGSLPYNFPSFFFLTSLQSHLPPCLSSCMSHESAHLPCILCSQSLECSPRAQCLKSSEHTLCFTQVMRHFLAMM